MRVFGITGRKNAGKTTLTEKLVAELTARGYRVSTVKHAHHATDVDQPGRDSHRHRQAGAVEVILASSNRWALMHELRGATPPELSDHLQKLSRVDLVLVEGYKLAPHPKLEIWRKANGADLLAPDHPTIEVLASDQGDGGTGLPVLDPNDVTGIADYIEARTGLTELKKRGSSMPEGVRWTPVEEVFAALKAAIHSIEGRETVALSAAAGRVLAEDAIARRSHPPARNSAVDGYGYAFDTVDFSAGPLPLAKGRAAAGVPYPGAVPPGHLLRILTGAHLPEGVDTVVLQEHVTLEGDHLRVTRPQRKKGANCRRAGEDMAAGDLALRAGALLRAPDLGLAAALGIAELTLRPRLRVGVLSTGSEIVPHDLAEDHPLQTPDANRPMLLAELTRLGFQPVDLGIVPDDRDAIRDALSRATTLCDAVLTSGGASQGDEDHTAALLREEADLQVWRVAVKPGRPLALAHWQGMPVFGLPGNPVAALVTALIFAVPALYQRAGAGWRAPQGFLVPAGFARVKQAGRREYLRARLTGAGTAEAFVSEGSGRVSGLSWAEGLIELPDAFCDIRPGDPVRFLPFQSFGP
ncbi:molybdopterin-guanine dinucleotide biosynthesis protein B [Falsigemmobacter faecalis]|uniref:Molybdopterin molybdenumtransferase n=1 Tax=Falsigemmobacter faecalis TaxID=2488730 RepID=A0A3P3DWS4_9RHOB|nr:molybdopterin-guanine dinucleotide biosynthesis protein B [Falsigemmobacter faecalis]RRH78206.1 molybdopterin-guanine dinucleotide biosynthesis protein B [Falsigemmobacter faecalis]